MRVLVFCEESGRIRDAFTKLGHFAVSCDLLCSATPGRHLQEEGWRLLTAEWGWDLLIAHPPCTYLAVSGARWYYHPEDKQLPVNERRPHPLYPNRAEDRVKGIDFFMKCINAPIPHIMVENPVGVMSTLYRKPDQIIQPWQFGHPDTKATCLWLKDLPPLRSTHIIEKGKRINSIHLRPPGPERGRIRGWTFQGIADAIAEQWGEYVAELHR